jgi:hypothetical protein
VDAGIVADITIDAGKLPAVIRQRGQSRFIIIKRPDLVPPLDEDINDLPAKRSRAPGY